MSQAPGAGQAWNPESYARHARFVSDLGGPVVDLLAPAPGERILDLGCGDGALTAQLAAAGADVVGVDASAPFVEAAQARGLDARLMDGRALTFYAEFDAVFSNAALHWIKYSEAMLAGVARALKPGGRFVAEAGGQGNIAAPRVAFLAALARRGIDARTLEPWIFPSPAGFSRRLEAHGFTVESIDLIPRPTALPGHVAGWLRTFGGPYLELVAPEEHDDFVAELVDLLEPVLCDDAGEWTLDYVRLRFRARLG